LVMMEEVKRKLSINIAEWGNNLERYLNVISPPFNSSEVFLDIIMQYAALEKTILYISNGKDSDMGIVSAIENYTDFKRYFHYISNSDIVQPLVIADVGAARDIDIKFDLVIYDDINSMPLEDSTSIAYLTEKVCKGTGKIITYSIESIFVDYKEIIIPVRDGKKPLLEPRIIVTRIDLNTDIPYVVFEYLKYSKKNKRNTIIYVPDEVKAKNVYRYLTSFHKSIFTDVELLLEEGDKKKVYKFIQRKGAILVTKLSDILCMNLKDIDIMVYFSDDAYFDYKRLVFLSGKVGRSEDNDMGEVIFVTGTTNYHIEKAKNLIREFNKKAWEMGLLEI